MFFFQVTLIYCIELNYTRSVICKLHARNLSHQTLLIFFLLNVKPLHKIQPYCITSLLFYQFHSTLHTCRTENWKLSRVSLSAGNHFMIYELKNQKSIYSCQTFKEGRSFICKYNAISVSKKEPTKIFLIFF